MTSTGSIQRIRRIDLRGTVPPDYREVVPRAGARRRRRRRVRPTDLRGRPGPGGRGDRRALAPLRRGRPRAPPRAAAGARRGPRRPRPCRPRGSGGVDRPAPAQLRGGARARRHDVLRRGRHGHPPDGADPAGRPLRPRRPGAPGVERRDERRPGAGRGRLVDRPGQLAAEGQRRAAGRDHPGRVRAARRARGLRGGWCPGDRDVRLRRGGVRAGRPGDRARQHLHGRGQAPAQGPDRHRLRGRPDRDR